ncbi:MAG: hypothetical protein OXF33_02130 [Rhodospirillales bacterium]|nr:hypothetical protein [Rhodospirillales bacterium]
MQKSKTDHAVAIAKAMVSAVPWVGGPLASLANDYIPSHTERARDRAIALLDERLEALGERLDAKAVNRDDFAELAKTCYLTIVRSHREEKLKAATGILANFLLREGDPDKLKYTELDYFARCVETLSNGAIEVLGNVVDAYQVGGRKNMALGDLFSCLPQYSSELLMGLVAELDAVNLLHRRVPSIEMPNHANNQVRLTPLGERFAQFLIEQDG